MRCLRGVVVFAALCGVGVWTVPSAEAGHDEDLAEAFHDAYEDADAEAVGELYAEDAVLVSNAFPAPLTGRAAIVAAEGFLFSAFCDPEWEATNSVKHGKEIAFEYTLAVDFCGPFPGPDGAMIPPHGGRVHLELATFIELRHGKIRYERRYADLKAFYDQLAAPSPG
jgi:predicted ester cyclase